MKGHNKRDTAVTTIENSQPKRRESVGLCNDPDKERFLPFTILLQSVVLLVLTLAPGRGNFKNMNFRPILNK